MVSSLKFINVVICLFLRRPREVEEKNDGGHSNIPSILVSETTIGGRTDGQTDTRVRDPSLLSIPTNRRTNGQTNRRHMSIFHLSVEESHGEDASSHRTFKRIVR